MSIFPQTPTTLLTRLAARLTGEDEANWTRFFELYQPAMVSFVSMRPVPGSSDAEDVVQTVLAKLVDILREHGYDSAKGRFRSYIATLLRNELFSLYRHERARPDTNARQLDGLANTPAEPSVPPVSAETLEADWAAARHGAAVRHVLGNTALAALSKEVFADLERTGDSCADVARRFGISAMSVRQIKSRVTRLVEAFERRMM